MPLIFGQTTSGLMVPVQVGATGIVTVSGITTLGAELPAGTQEIGKIQSRAYGWIGGAWQKGPLPFGYSGDWTEQKVNLNAAAGANALIGTAVPAGEIWLVQAADALNNITNPTSILLNANVNGINVTLTRGALPGIGVSVYWTGSIVLSQGDTIIASIFGCTLNDDIYMNYHAVRVDIDQ